MVHGFLGNSWEQKGYRLLRNTLDAEVHVSDGEEEQELEW